MTMMTTTSSWLDHLIIISLSCCSELVHWTMIQAGGLVKDQSYRAVYRYGGQIALPDGGGSQLMANYDTPDFYQNIGPGTDCWVQVGR